MTITPHIEGVANVISSEDSSIRIEVLQQLAEQAMSDPAFRAEAALNLPVALEKHGYRLTAQELALVVRFRRSLADAGVDLDLVAGMGDDQLAGILDRLQRRAARTGRS
jgi:hypothetical protein